MRIFSAPSRSCLRTLNFHPRSPHGERRSPHIQRFVRLGFQSTLPVRGATAYCYVSGAEAVELTLSMTVQMLPNAAQETVTASVKAAVSDYLKSIAFTQNYVSYARINAAILEADGVQDVSGLTVNGATANVAIRERQAAVLGEVSIQYGAGA